MTTTVPDRVARFVAADPTTWAADANQVAATRGLPPVTADDVAAAQAEVRDLLAAVRGTR